MKPISNYIVERIRIDNIKCAFPIDGSTNDMIKFLESNGFMKIPFKIGGIFNLLNKKSAKQFVILSAGGITRFWFADTSNHPISEDNPVFLIISKNKTGGEREFAYSNTDLKNHCNKQEFIEMLNKRFGASMY